MIRRSHIAFGIMYKRGLFLFLFFIVALAGFLRSALAQYLNDSWVRERSEKYLSGEDRTVPVGDDLRFMLKRLLPDSVTVDPNNMTVGLRPPKL